jgi:hypothetical protein
MSRQILIELPITKNCETIFSTVNIHLTCRAHNGYDNQLWRRSNHYIAPHVTISWKLRLRSVLSPNDLRAIPLCSTCRRCWHLCLPHPYILSLELKVDNLVHFVLLEQRSQKLRPDIYRRNVHFYCFTRFLPSLFSANIKLDTAHRLQYISYKRRFGSCICSPLHTGCHAKIFFIFLFVLRWVEISNLPNPSRRTRPWVYSASGNIRKHNVSGE